MYKDFIAAMSKDFDLSASGELKWFLGGKVEQDREKGIVRLSLSLSLLKDRSEPRRINPAAIAAQLFLSLAHSLSFSLARSLALSISLSLTRSLTLHLELRDC